MKPRQKPSILDNQSGVALLMVMSSVVLLTVLLATFTFDTELNRLKSSNVGEKLQARLNAESGLKFALAKLRLYQEARNLIEKNESMKKIAKPGVLEEIIIQPFVYPIPKAEGLNLVQKTAIEEFEKTTIMNGQLTVTISRVSGFINPNNMRVPVKKDEEKGSDTSGDADDEDNEKIPPDAYIQKKLLETLTNAFQAQKEADVEFETLYGNLDPKLMVKELKYYVNHPNDFKDDAQSEIEALYSDKGSTPKHAPLTSIDELYLLEGWPDAIVDLIKDRLTVHEVAVIAINEINKSQLEILFPNLGPEQLEEFFKYRDGDKEVGEEPHQFSDEAEFKSYLVGTLGMNEEIYTKRVKEFAAAGLKFGVAGKLFKVVSEGRFNRTTYKLTAFIDLPIKPPPPKKKKTKKEEEDEKKKQDEEKENDEDKDKDEDEEKKKDKKVPEVLLKPRVVEIRHG